MAAKVKPGSIWLALSGTCAVLALAQGAVADTARPDTGAALYAKHCASCHGARLEGQPNWRYQKADGTLPAPPHDSSGHTWHHSDRLNFDYTKYGGAEAMRRRGAAPFASGMPGFADVLTDAEIRAIFGFIKQHWGPRERAYQKAVSDQE